MHAKKPMIAVTMGDPGGIGPEVIARVLRSSLRPRAADILVIGSEPVFRAVAKKTGIEIPLRPIASPDPFFPKPGGGIYFLDITRRAALLLERKGLRGLSPRKPFEIGTLCAQNGALAYAAMEAAAAEAMRKTVSAVVTAPVNKAAVRLLAPGFCGHTEFFAGKAGCGKFAMMFTSDRLKVTLVTIHVPLCKVSRLVKAGPVFDKIALTDDFLKRHFCIPKPRLAVCALNPHGRETGEEDEREVRPAVERARTAGISAEGPLPGDQVFYDAYAGKFDGVISMYHDQGLAPFKMIAFDQGVNVTLGLPFIRTSPDHGTAFDIAYRGRANPSSFGAALALAAKLIRGGGVGGTKKNP